MASREELLAQARRKRLLEQAKAKRAAEQATPVQEEPETEGLDLQDVRGLGQTLLNAQTVGFGDELVGAVRTGMEMLNPASYGEGTQSFADTYKMYRDDARNSEDEFAEENPASAVAASLVGGIASPINKVAPGYGTTGTPLARTMQSAGRGSVEGAIAGFGEGEGDIADQVANAGKGGLAGGLFSGLLTGGGGALGRTLSKRRVDRELGYGDEFVPAHLADPEGNVGSFYRKFVGNAIGGRGALGRQESDYLSNNPRITGLADGGETMFPHTVGTRTAIDNMSDAIKNEAKVAKDTLDRKVASLPKASALPKAKALADEAAQTIDQQGTREMFELAMPDSMPEEIKDTIRQSDFRQAEDALSKWWADEGFQTVKGRQFDWDDGLKRQVRSLSENNPEFALTLGNAAAQVDGLVERLVRQGKKAEDLVPQDFIDELTKADIVGINGDALMAIRNAFAIPSNKGGPSLKGKAQRQVVDKFDSLIKRQLAKVDENLPDMFQSELDSWGTKQGVSKAVLQAKKSGKDIVKPTDVTRKMRGGKSNEPAFTVAEQAERAKKEAAAAQAQASAAQAEELGKKKSALKNARRRVEQRARASTNRLERETKGKLDTPPSSWSQLASTAILGAPTGFGVGTLPAGIATAAALARPSSQRVIAGQTGRQKWLAKALRQGATSPYTRNLSRAAALAATGQDEEEQY